MNDELLADLGYIVGYAGAIRSQLTNGETPLAGYVNRMAELAEKVQRQLDPEYKAWCDDAESRSRIHP